MTRPGAEPKAPGRALRKLRTPWGARGFGLFACHASVIVCVHALELRGAHGVPFSAGNVAVVVGVRIRTIGATVGDALLHRVTRGLQFLR